ncbi:MerR family transcriptional regulator [Clostridium thermarum]|uniref:MerR family transcriptional regulator n=1 Tax=Clostridium thermarum TaxID=1716543 RepID=UPI0013D8A42F|nr:MerR family transcriptional regulator [Clostridium thermarum]
MYRIGQFSKMSKTTIKALRYYDEVDLLKPEVVDDFTGYRFYTSNQLVKLHYIQALRQLGLSIEEIKLITNGHGAKAILQNRKKELESEIANALEQLSRIEFILLGKEELDFMNYQAVIKELPECIVYSKKLTVSNYNEYFKVIPEIGKQVTTKYPDLKCAVPEYCFISYLDGEYKEKDINIEFCEAVDMMRENFDDIIFKKVEKVTAISVMHKGAYSGLSKAYAYAFKWIEENGYTIADNPRENYIDGIWNKDSEDQWLTELQIPVVKR